MKPYPWSVRFLPTLLVLTLCGCLTPPVGIDLGDDFETDSATVDVDSALKRANELYQAGDFSGALEECVHVSRTVPTAKGVDALRNKIITAITEERVQLAIKRRELSRARMAVEAEEQTAIPDTYRLRRFVHGVSGSHLSPPGPMREVLDAPVTMHLKGADLSAFIAAISADERVNIIADRELGQGRALDIEVDDVRLREVLDYVSRNFGIHFYLGEKIIWAVAPGGAANAPMETRVYRLRKGVQFHGSDWAASGVKVLGAPEKTPLTYKATELPTGKTYLEEIIEKFVPQEEGAQLHLDRNTHNLYARNTVDNLEAIEAIVDSLDVTPPQVLIEARFVEVGVADLRELGIEWILDAPAAVTKKWVNEGGTWKRVAKTQLGEGELVTYSPYVSDGEGAFPLGPQGAFGLARQGNPTTADQGLNLTYQGILTQPMFSAVLHALEISGKGRTISVPRVTTLNNNPAKLRHGEDLRFYEEFKAQAFNLLDDNNRKYAMTVLIPSGKPALEELGITLVAVPSVGADRNSISLVLTPTISELEGFVSYQEAEDDPLLDKIRQVVVKLPIISRREIQTKVVVESGETVVMGGLIDSVEQETLHKVPFLGSIPIIGKFFQRMDVTEQKENLIVFVTATVISERGESLIAVPSTDEFRAVPESEPVLGE